MFLGHIVSSAGLKLDLSKVEAISKMNTSTNKDDIDHLRGMVAFIKENRTNRLSPCKSDQVQLILRREQNSRTFPFNHHF